MSTDHLFTVDFTALPDGLLMDNHPRPNMYWARDIGTDGGFTFPTPTIVDGALVASPGDTGLYGCAVFPREVGNLYLPLYPGYTPPWGGGKVYADTGELELRFTLPPRGITWPTSSAFTVGFGCAGSPANAQPWFDFGVDESVNFASIRCTFSYGVTPYTVPTLLAESLLLFGGVVNTAQLKWDRFGETMDIRWILNGETVYTRTNSYFLPSRTPRLRVWPGASVTLFAIGLNPEPPVVIFGYWLNKVNVTETP